MLGDIERNPQSFFSDEANGPEAYVDQIKRDNHLQEYNDALALYASDPAYWERWYTPLPSPDPAAEIQHDTVRAAGVPSRYNVFEYGYPEPSAPADEGSLNPNQVVNDRFGTWASAPAFPAPPNAPGFSGSFNDRFGRWGSVPADGELIRRRSSAAPDPPVQTNTAFEMPGSTFGRLFVEAAHLAANGMPPSPSPFRAAPSGSFDTTVPPHSLPSGIRSVPRQAAFNDRFGDWPASSSPEPAKLDPRDVRVLSSRLIASGRGPL